MIAEVAHGPPSLNEPDPFSSHLQIALSVRLSTQGDIILLRSTPWLIALTIVAIHFANKAQAEFDLGLSILGGGRVMVFPNGGAPLLPNPLDPTNIYFTAANLPSGPLRIPRSDALLVAAPLGFEVTPPSNPISLPYGADLIMDLDVVLGIRFVRWSGGFVPSNDRNGEAQEETSEDYWVVPPAPGGDNSIVANFSPAASDNEIVSIEATLPLSATPVAPFAFSFTENDDSSTDAIEGIMRLTWKWDDLVSGVNAGQINNIQLRFQDENFNEFYMSFGLDVGSSAAVPEPASWALVAVGAAGAALWRKRKRGRGMGT